jgi:uncharacterized membrane protein YjjP (DUF1212 family)
MTPITKDATNSGMNMVVDLLCIGVISLSFLYLQGGNFQNIVITFIAGLLGFLIVECVLSFDEC